MEQHYHLPPAPTPRGSRQIGRLTCLLGLVMLLAACTATKPPATRIVLDSPQSLLIEGENGPITFDALVTRAAEADVVVLGEQHDDALGHAVQLALFEAIVQRCPEAALALEMLERDEQGLIADYRDGIIDAKKFAALTRSSAWAGEGSWDAWYGPIVDAAISQQAAVVAANAPRRYVTLARTDGFDALQALDGDRRTLVDLPEPPLSGPYRDRFMELMLDEDGTPHVADDVAEAFFRAQQVWDATMASSVVRALEHGHRPVVLLVGRFHSDYEGGTVELIKRAKPEAAILTVSLEPEDARAEADLGRADVVVFTGSGQ
ncbi:MAG: ChaN family lipoprotein [Phycisphaerales bacterium]|nr:ChaN family lipoprotein [Phycisphaerales bacterium]